MIQRRSIDDPNWQSLCRILECRVRPKFILCVRSLEDIETRSLTLSEKGKVARVLDKAQDSGEVIKLIEKLRQAILIYQVSVKHRQGRKSLRHATDVATAVNIRPGSS